MATDGYGQVIGAVNESDYTNVKGVFPLAEVTRLQRKGKWPANIYIGGQGSQAFTTPGATTFIVPQNVSVIRVKLWGASGGGGCGYNTNVPYSGGGGFTLCDIAVTAGEVLDLLIGGGGAAGRQSGGSGGTNAVGGGGKGGSRNSGAFLGGGGGGRSEITRGINRLATAGGGGGCGSGSGSQNGAGRGGGAGGGTSGESTSAAGGGTQSAGGLCLSGSGGGVGASGAQNTGGDGGPIDGASGTSPGGGGGGGLYGGAGAAEGNGGGGGGGGSSYVHPTFTTNATLTAGSADTPGGSGDADYASPAGLGVLAVNTGTGTAGNSGRIVITW